MQSVYGKGSDEPTDDSGATDICAHCAPESKLQPALYFCFHCGPFGRYMCGNCNRQHKKFAYKHEVKSVSTAAQQTREPTQRVCDETKDESGATDTCAHCASDNNIKPACFFCFHCGPYGRYMCGICNKQHKKFACGHDVRQFSSEAEQLQKRDKTQEPSSLQKTKQLKALDENQLMDESQKPLSSQKTKQLESRDGHQFFKELVPCGQKKRRDYLCVVAIKLGKKNSSYAYSTTDGFDKDPLKVTTSTSSRYDSCRLGIPTCVLFDANKQFLSFGLEAKNNYEELFIDDEHKDYYFFREFILYDFYNKLINQKLMLEDVRGKKMDAMVVFSACIKILREYAMRDIQRFTIGFTDNDFRWVLTVPAISNDASKQFIREAAQKAGIKGELIRIAIRSQAASLYCRYLHEANWIRSETACKPWEPKSKFLIIEITGGMIEMCIYDVNDNGRLEWSTAHGGYCSNSIDKDFRDFLASIFGHLVMDKFKATYTEDYQILLRDFKMKQKYFHRGDTKRIAFKVPSFLLEEFEEKTGQKIIDQLKRMEKYNGKVAIRNAQLNVARDIFEGWIKETSDRTVSLLKELLSKPEAHDVPTIFLVGKVFQISLIQSDIVSDILSAFRNKCIIFPEEDQFVVSKGAVIFGHLC